MKLKIEVIVAIVLVICAIVILHVEGRRCSFKKGTNHLTFHETYKPCKKTYRSRCSWFSLDYCTFYHEQFCKQRTNRTVVTYSTVQGCCESFIEAPNGTCVAIRKVKNKHWYKLLLNATTEAPVVENNDKLDNKIDIIPIKKAKEKNKETSFVKVKGDSDSLKLSHGAYAGIACGLLFTAIIVVLVLLAVRKKQKRRQRMKRRNDELSAHYSSQRETQRMVIQVPADIETHTEADKMVVSSPASSIQTEAAAMIEPVPSQSNDGDQKEG